MDRSENHNNIPALWFFLDRRSKVPSNKKPHRFAMQVAPATAPAYTFRSIFLQRVGSLQRRLAYAKMVVAAVAAMARAANNARGRIWRGEAISVSVVARVEIGLNGRTARSPR